MVSEQNNLREKKNKSVTELKKENAYMTVEASMIMPIMVIGIVFTIYIGIYLYNACIIHQTAYLAALRGSQQKELNQTQIEQYTLNQLNLLIENRILATKEIRKQVRVNVRNVTVSLSATLNMPFSDFISEKAGIWNYSTKAEAVRIQPVKTIRYIRQGERK